jgi:hypothetical protein
MIEGPLIKLPSTVHREARSARALLLALRAAGTDQALHVPPEELGAADHLLSGLAKRSTPVCTLVRGREILRSSVNKGA